MIQSMLFFLFTLGSLRLAGQASYGFGVIVATAEVEGKVSKTVFLTDVVNLDSLSGRLNRVGSLRHRRNAFAKSVNKWVLDMIEKQQPGLQQHASLTNLNQVELHPGFHGRDQKRVRQLNKKLGIEPKIAFMNQLKAEKRRGSMLRNANSELTATVVLLTN